MNEALDLEGQLKVKGIPVTMDLVRTVLGTPGIEDLIAAPTSTNLEFMRFLIDPRVAEGKDLAFTLVIDGEVQAWSLHLRNGVLVISTAGSPTVDHKRLTRRELAEFILGKRSLGEVGTIFADFDSCLDRSDLLSAEAAIASVLGEPRERLRTDAYGQQ